ncbi:unnamed protein product [Durusdinium trenchii]|eukprot:g13164.t1
MEFQKPLALPLGPLPLWFLALWANFGCVAEYLLLFRPYLVGCAFLGCIFGPLAYLGGEELKALQIHGRFGLGMVALEWSLCFPLLVAVADWCLAPKALAAHD